MTVAQHPRDTTGSTIATTIEAWEGRHQTTRTDLLAVEEPLEIRLAGCSVAVTMRTPGDDFDLAAGFLFTEGIIPDRSAIASMAYCPTDGETSGTGNIVNVNPVDPSLVEPEKWTRNFFASSSCGVCGKASIDSVHLHAPSIATSTPVESDVLYSLDSQLKASQDVFSHTGGLHAAALFDLSGNLLVVREDVGRHNAVDKVIGYAFREGMVPLYNCMLMVSSRGSFEIVQKALMAGIPLVATVSAPSSLAVDLARSANMTLLGFLRSDRSGSGRFNIYAGADRIRVTREVRPA